MFSWRYISHSVMRGFTDLHYFQVPSSQQTCYRFSSANQSSIASRLGTYRRSPGSSHLPHSNETVHMLMIFRLERADLVALAFTCRTSLTQITTTSDPTAIHFADTIPSFSQVGIGPDRLNELLSSCRCSINAADCWNHCSAGRCPAFCCKCKLQTCKSCRYHPSEIWRVENGRYVDDSPSARKIRQLPRQLPRLRNEQGVDYERAFIMCGECQTELEAYRLKPLADAVTTTTSMDTASHAQRKSWKSCANGTSPRMSACGARDLHTVHICALVQDTSIFATTMAFTRRTGTTFQVLRCARGAKAGCIRASLLDDWLTIDARLRIVMDDMTFSGRTQGQHRHDITPV